MNYFYNTENNSFLVEGLHTIPDGAIAVGESEYQDLIDGRAKGKVITVMNGTLTLTSVRPSTYHTWNGKEWVIDAEKQAVLKAQKIEQIKTKINALRDEKSAGGCYVESLGKWFDSDQAAYNNLLGFKAETDLNGGKTIYWACADNSLIEFDREKLKTVISTLWDVKTSNHATALKHKAMLEQAENPEDYDFTSGWVKTYDEYVKEQNNGEE